ncbi:MAG TPA: hypothetical protein VIL35_08990 [Vicinamibacterales bacterium]
MSDATADPAASTAATMEELRARVREALHARLVARGAGDDFDSRATFDEVDALFRRALAHDDRQALLIPDLLAQPSRPELSLRFASHRGGAAGAFVSFAKRRVLLPLVRWLFEYTQENFRRQEHLNVALLACLQTLAADHARLKARVAALETERGAPAR